jgi:hypothetical protein
MKYMPDFSLDLFLTADAWIAPSETLAGPEGPGSGCTAADRAAAGQPRPDPRPRGTASRPYCFCGRLSRGTGCRGRDERR